MPFGKAIQDPRPNPTLLNIEDLAGELGTSGKMAQRLVAIGALPSVDVADGPRVLTTDLVDYVRRGSPSLQPDFSPLADWPDNDGDHPLWEALRNQISEALQGQLPSQAKVQEWADATSNDPGARSFDVPARLTDRIRSIAFSRGGIADVPGEENQTLLVAWGRESLRGEAWELTGTMGSGVGSGWDKLYASKKQFDLIFRKAVEEVGKGRFLGVDDYMVKGPRGEPDRSVRVYALLPNSSVLGLMDVNRWKTTAF